MSTGGRKTRRRYQSRLTSTLPSSTLALWWVWLLEHSRCLSSFLSFISPPSSFLHSFLHFYPFIIYYLPPLFSLSFISPLYVSPPSLLLPFTSLLPLSLIYPPSLFPSLLSFLSISSNLILILRQWNVLMIHSTIWSPWQQRDYILHSQNDIHA